MFQLVHVLAFCLCSVLFFFGIFSMYAVVDPGNIAVTSSLTDCLFGVRGKISVRILGGASQYSISKDGCANCITFVVCITTNIKKLSITKNCVYEWP